MTETEQALALIEKLVSKRTSPQEGMHELCDLAESCRPLSAWKELRRFNYAGDLANLEKWFNQLLKDEPPGDTINGIYFGLFESADAYVLYVCGSEHYEPKDEDWPCDPAWWPDLRLAVSPFLTLNLHPVLKRMSSEERLLGEYCFWLGYSALAAAHLCRVMDRRLLLGNLKSRAVAVGFDEGDVVNLPPLEMPRFGSRSAR